MKKKASGKQKTGASGMGAPKTVDEYVAGVSEPARSMLVEMRTVIGSAVPRDAVETISYRMPAVRQKKVLVWFAAFKDHCSLFPTAAVIEAFKEELDSKGISTSKGTVRFPIDRPLPKALIKKLVKARAARSSSAGG